MTDERAHPDWRPKFALSSDAETSELVDLGPAYRTRHIADTTFARSLSLWSKRAERDQ